MTRCRRLFLLLPTCALAPCLLTPPVQLAVQALGVPLSADQIWRRLGILSLAVVFLLCAPRRKELREGERAFLPRTNWTREVGYGFGMAFLLGLAIVVFLVGTDFMYLDLDWSWSKHGWGLLTWPLTAFWVALLEEFLFRQVLFVSLWRDAGRRFAILVSSFLYASLHFFEAPSNMTDPPASIFSGFAVAGEMLHGFQDPESLPTMLGLFLLGVVLALARLLTGRIYLAIGFHAGLILFSRIDGRFTSWFPGSESVLTGGRYYIAGLTGWFVLLSVAAIFYLLLRSREPTAQPVLVRLRKLLPVASRSRELSK